MKKLKLFLAAIAIAFSGLGQAFAADWAAATLEAGKHYFLNVGANKWLGAGNSLCNLRYIIFIKLIIYCLINSFKK